MAGPTPIMHFLDSLNILDLTKLKNDLILHNHTWPNMPTKLPSNIPKFEGKSGEDPAKHVMSFHLWCSSNIIMEDSINLWLFQGTLTGTISKWYVDDKTEAHSIFESLSKAFLSFFQLPIHHDTGFEILLECKQNTTTHCYT
jgi:hypothetical protein